MNTLLRSRLPKILLATALLAGLIATGGPPPAVAAPGTTAWQNGSFVVFTAQRFDKATIGLAKGNGVVALKARANAKYVTAGTGTPLIANRDAIGPWEQFDLIEGVA